MAVTLRWKKRSLSKVKRPYLEKIVGINIPVTSYRIGSATFTHTTQTSWRKPCFSIGAYLSFACTI